jgi:hypothetical protein
MAKVSPAGVNKFGYRSDNSPVVLLFMGRIAASALTTTVPMKPTKFKIDKGNTRRFLFIITPPSMIITL